MRNAKGEASPNGYRKFCYRAAALFAALAVAAVSYTVTVMAWFQDSLNTSAQISAGRYAARLDILDAATDTPLWSSGVEGITSFDGDIALDGFAGPAVIRVSGYQFGEGTLPFAYTLQGQPAEVLQPGEVREHKTEITDGGISLQFFTAYHNQAIYTAADAAALRDTAYPAGSVVYLTADIAADVLTFDGRYPNLNLNGHTLAVDRLEIHAAAGVYTTMCVENGVLTIGGRTYRDGEQLPVSGDGHVAPALRGLRDAQAG